MRKWIEYCLKCDSWMIGKGWTNMLHHGWQSTPICIKCGNTKIGRKEIEEPREYNEGHNGVSSPITVFDKQEVAPMREGNRVIKALQGLVGQEVEILKAAQAAEVSEQVAATVFRELIRIGKMKKSDGKNGRRSKYKVLGNPSMADADLMYKNSKRKKLGLPAESGPLTNTVEFEPSEPQARTNTEVILELLNKDLLISAGVVTLIERAADLIARLEARLRVVEGRLV